MEHVPIPLHVVNVVTMLSVQVGAVAQDVLLVG
jgi:hypothetical protein